MNGWQNSGQLEGGPFKDSEQAAAYQWEKVENEEDIIWSSGSSRAGAVSANLTHGRDSDPVQQKTKNEEITAAEGMPLPRVFCFDEIGPFQSHYIPL